MVRLLGLRSFAKMSSTDFVTTVAIGSLMANIISAPSPSVAIGLASLVSLFLLKYTVATTRRHFELARQLLDNKPAYLMDGPNINHDALSEHHISVEELHAKLRQANVWSYEQVICVVLETTGDISVINKTDENAEIESAIFDEIDQLGIDENQTLSLTQQRV